MSNWIAKDIPRPQEQLVRALGELPAGLLGDCMNRLQTMPAADEVPAPESPVVRAGLHDSVRRIVQLGGRARPWNCPSRAISARGGAVCGHVMTYGFVLSGAS
jgi:hypothetical protein